MKKNLILIGILFGLFSCQKESVNEELSNDNLEVSAAQNSNQSPSAKNQKLNSLFIPNNQCSPRERFDENRTFNVKIIISSIYGGEYSSCIVNPKEQGEYWENDLYAENLYTGKKYYPKDGQFGTEFFGLPYAGQYLFTGRRGQYSFMGSVKQFLTSLDEQEDGFIYIKLQQLSE